MALKFIEDAELEGKTVLARFDFNVPLQNGEISDSSRVDLALPTIQKILEKGASKLIMMSHMGRPNGKVNKKYSLEPVATYLANLLNEEVLLTENPVDVGISSMLKLKSTKIVLLENLRFHPGEESNDRDFALKLAEGADVYVNDAFGAAHRKHASVHAIINCFPKLSYAGQLMKKEIQELSKIVDSPEKPFVAIVGGAKVSDKIKILERLLPTVEKLLIGGAMAYPFLKAKGHEVGKSLCSDQDVELAKKILTHDPSGKITLPKDHVAAEEFAGKALAVDDVEIPEGLMALDIGPKTQELYAKILQKAKTILWNGPMGIFEYDDFSKGTFSIAHTLAQSDALTIVGGGDSVAAVHKAGVAEKLSHVSTGGGASLEFIQNGQLPGVQALKFGV